MKRLGIFYCFDEDGIIDEYITYLLNDISQNLDELCIVYTGDLTDESIEKLKIYANDIIQSNKRYDAEAYGDVMINHYGWESLSKFDEIILFNDSFFGPFYSFKSIFDKINDENIDFWGITCHNEKLEYGEDEIHYKYEPKHLQTYFLVLRRNIITSLEFQEYWREFPVCYDLDDLHFKHEIVFTKYFEDLGFKWKSYIDTSDLEDSIEDSMDLYSFDMYNLVVNKNLPIINRESFKLPRKIHLSYNMSSELSKTIDYLNNYVNYDASLIYKYFIRKLDPSRFVEIFNLIKIFPKDNAPINYKSNNKILLVVHLYYVDLMEYDFNYLKNIPEYIDILITTDSDEKKQFFEKNITNNLNNYCRVLKVNSRGRDMSALFVASRDILKEYDYFCFMHDKKSSGSGYITAGATFRDVLWENNLASTSYIENIIREFDENSLLGLIVPPKVYHSRYFGNFIYEYWIENYDITLNLMGQLDVNTPIDKKYPPLSIGNCFWAKYDALKPLFDLNLTYDDFHEEPMPPDNTISHALERIYSYVAADNGYYTEFVMTEEYAKSEILNLNHMLLETFSTIKSNQVGFIDYSLFNHFNITLNDLLSGNNRKIKHHNENNNDIKKLKAEKDKQINQKNNEIKKLKQERKEILSSSSWKLTKPLRNSKLLAKKVFKIKNNSKSNDKNNESVVASQSILNNHMFSIKNFHPII